MDTKIKILIADDINNIAEKIKKEIEKNINVEIIGIANNGQDELNMILQYKPDLVITDNTMPKMSGVEVIEKFHNSNINSKPDFILFTGDCSSELNKKCIDLGIYMILDKLIGIERLSNIVDEYIERIKNNSNSINSIKIERKTGIFKKIKEKLKKEYR